MTRAPFVPLSTLVVKVMLPTFAALINPVTVPLSPGPTSFIVPVFTVSVSYTHLTLPTKA